MVKKKKDKKSRQNTPLGQARASAPSYLPQFQRVIALHRAGQLAAAEQGYLGIIGAFAGTAEVFHALGVLYFQQQRLDEAARVVQQALAINGAHTAYLLDMGRIQRKRQQFTLAQACFEQVVALNPQALDALTELGSLHFAQGALDLAAQRFRTAVSLQPGNLYLRNCLAKTEFERFDWRAARSLYEETQRLAPQDSASLLNLVTLYRVVGDFSAAKALFQRRIDAAPDNLELRLHYGRFLTLIEDPAAEAQLRQIIAQDPVSIAALLQLYRVLRWRNPSEAWALLERAAQLDGERSDTLALRAGGMVDRGMAAAAEPFFRRAMAHSPSDLGLQSAWVFTSNYRSDLSPAQLLERHRQVGQRYQQSATTSLDPPAAVAVAGEMERTRRLRVGYISPDLHQHSVSYFFEPLLAGHDRDQVTVFCYSDSPRRDAVNARLRGLADHWVDIAGISDAGVRRRIRADRIDILVELAGHSAANRLGVLAAGAAPVQVTYLGYCNTSAIPRIQYRISDQQADPVGVGEQQNSETLLRLDGGFLCYQPEADAPAVAPVPALAHGFVRFGCFNVLAKLSEQTLRLWAQLLQRIPSARLTLKSQGLDDPPLCAELRQRCERAGLDCGRVDLVGRVESVQQHLALYHQIDIALDTMPYNGTTTTCEALWMGVPVLTLRGDRHAGRVGASLLQQLDLAQWVAADEPQFIATGVRLAADLDTLASLRAGLRQRMRASPLLDRQRICRELERHYREVWRIALG